MIVVLIADFCVIVWGLTIIVSLKCVALILRADNRGEGGIMALMALAMSSVTQKSRWYYPLMLVGLTGAALFYGDGVITPAISVLSAIEGLEVATPAFQPYVVPITVAVRQTEPTVANAGRSGGERAGDAVPDVGWLSWKVEHALCSRCLSGARLPRQCRTPLSSSRWILRYEPATRSRRPDRG